MIWLLGWYGLVLVHVSGALRVVQRPRFIGAKTHQNVRIRCVAPGGGAVRWYRLEEYDEDRSRAVEVKADGRFKTNGDQLTISGVRVEDRGLYLCKVNATWGSGTGLQVVLSSSRVKNQSRTDLKDALMVVQALMLVGWTATVMMYKRTLKKRDSVYEEPDDDHIYEGLDVGKCEEDLYEDLSRYNPDQAEAPWE